MKVNVAIIGTGNMGRNHARVYSELEEVELVAVADVSDNGRKIAKKYDSSFYNDYLQMLQKEDLDAISICVPTSLHKKVALDCIEKGVNILIEKPIASNVEDASLIIEKADEKGVILSVGHIERFNPAVQRLKEITPAKIGTPTSIIARRVGIFPPQIRDANVFIDLAVHDIDIFNYLLDDSPIEIYAKSGTALSSGREDHATIIISYKETNCFVQVNWITPVKIRELSITGTKGYAELNYITQELRVFETSVEKSYDSFGDFVLNFGAPTETYENLEFFEPLKSELSNFIKCVLNHNTPMVTGDDGRRSLFIATKAIESYKKGVAIKL